MLNKMRSVAGRHNPLKTRFCPSERGFCARPGSRHGGGKLGGCLLDGCGKTVWAVSTKEWFKCCLAVEWRLARS